FHISGFQEVAEILVRVDQDTLKRHPFGIAEIEGVADPRSSCLRPLKGLRGELLEVSFNVLLSDEKNSIMAGNSRVA
ncbi:hypothetical protein R0J87_19275, partial [Halomonas sp. SIMBA_159]